VAPAGGVCQDMGQALRFFLAVLLVLCAFPLVGARSAPLLERGAAITDPLVLRELDRGRFGLGHLLAPARSPNPPLNDSELFALPSLAPLRKSIEEELRRYFEQHKAASPAETVGVGSNFDLQLFDSSKLYSPETRFVLAGIVNRMDRTYLSKENCGEIRLIYRLVDTKAAPLGDHAITPRLPMTLNLVLRTKGDRATDKNGKSLTCAEIARRWLAAGEATLTGAALAEKLSSDGGPLESILPENIERIETNFQISHTTSSGGRDFRSDYLLKVFDYDEETRAFEEATLENQIDVKRILADEKLKREFKTWLLDDAHFAELDRGTILIPKEFLATRAIAPTPIGFAPSELQPAFGLVQGEGDGAVFARGDIVGALENAAARGVNLQNIRSVAGFERRLNDVTCAGCHQTRGIGGFHFPGVDWMAENPSNSIVVPGSPHFFGDQIRRRNILASLRDGKPPDFSRGFSVRPQLRGSHELAGTEYEDGWGAPCYAGSATAKDNDLSFKSWTCAKGLACQVMSEVSRIGMCFVGSR
jgi:hypothetical protein